MELGTPLFIQYEIWGFIASFYVGSLQSKYGREVMIRLDLFLGAFAAFCFVSLKYVENTALFLIIAFSGRIIQGISTALF